MAKRILVDTINKVGQDDRGYPVVDIRDTQAEEFECHSTLTWHSCSNDNVEILKYYLDPNTSTIRKVPLYWEDDQESDAGALATDADGNPTERYEWDYTTDTWTKVTI